MPTLDTLAAQFARCVSLFRDPTVKDEQKKAFRALLALLPDTAVTLRVAPGGAGLEVNGAPCQGDQLATLVQRLDLHGIGEIALPAAPKPAHLFVLLQALADQPGAQDVASRVASVGADRIRVKPAASSPPITPGAVASPPDIERREAPVTRVDGPVDRRSRDLGTDGILRGDAWRDIASVPLDGVPLVTHDPPPPAAADALPEAGRAQRREPTARNEPPTKTPPTAPVEPTLPPRARPSASTVPSPAPAAPPASPAPPSASARPPREAAQGVELPAGAPEALAELERDGAGPNVGDVLATLGGLAESAAKAGRYEQVLGVIAGIIGVEQSIGDTSGVRRQYAIALRRIYTKPVLEGLARLVATPRHRDTAVVGLQRGGAAAVEVLLDLLAVAPTMNERRAVFDALKHMTEGTEQLVHMLDHSEWYVVRNVAELIGELGMEDAVPALAQRLGHEDERVRKAVGMALAKIGTRSAAEPLRRALRDRSVEVRMHVALGIGGRKSSALAMPLVVAMEEEKDEAVVRELMLALGRIGSPDAVQALIKWAQPAGRIFGRRPSELRVAAVEGLRLAATAAALGTLEGLSDDGDRQVREEARLAVADLKRRPPPSAKR
jgi:HEAT repeat protein/PBS lyase HEAT-like repeat-containing protein